MHGRKEEKNRNAQFMNNGDLESKKILRSNQYYRKKINLGVGSLSRGENFRKTRARGKILKNEL